VKALRQLRERHEAERELRAALDVELAEVKARAEHLEREGRALVEALFADDKQRIAAIERACGIFGVDFAEIARRRRG
jgi:hypothetical protein